MSKIVDLAAKLKGWQRLLIGASVTGVVAILSALYGTWFGVFVWTTGTAFLLWCAYVLWNPTPWLKKSID